MLYFEVLAKCGHVGKGFYVPIHFAVVAKDGKHAASKVRYKPRVKHDHKDAILSVRKITFEEFMKLRSDNDTDPYLHCKNVQQQRGIENFADRLVPEKRKKQAKTRNPEFKIKKNKIIVQSAKKAMSEWC